LEVIFHIKNGFLDFGKGNSIKYLFFINTMEILIEK
jgi:hypothetical protein